MMIGKHVARAVGAALALTMGMIGAGGLSVEAAPIELTFSGIAQDPIAGPGTPPPIPTVTAGDTFDIRLLFDNGAMTLANQSFARSDLVSASFMIGPTYVATMTSFASDGGFDLTTDGAGDIATLGLVDVRGSGSDTNGASEFTFFLNGLNDVFVTGPFAGPRNAVGASSPPTPENSRIALAPAVPLPAAAWLLLGGLGALAVAARRRV